MLFLTADEKKRWRALADEILASREGPPRGPVEVRPGLLSAFHYYVGTFLAAQEQSSLGNTWIQAGAAVEGDGCLANQFLTDFLERHQGKLVSPTVVFADP